MDYYRLIVILQTACISECVGTYFQTKRIKNMNNGKTKDFE